MLDQNNNREITIETLTTPPLHIQPAPLTRRFAATLIDSLIIGLAWIAVAIITGRATFLEVSLASGITLYLIVYFYYSVMEGLLSGTLGKRALRIRVVGDKGEPCTFTESAVRNLFRLFDWLPFCYLLGLVCLSLSDKKQRVGDRIAHTIVTMVPERDEVPPPAPFLFH